MFRTRGLTNFTSNTVDIYEYNNTTYVVTAYQEGVPLTRDGISTLKDTVAIVKSVAKVIAKIHHKGYLYLDVKPENVLTLAGTTELVQLFDFDSLVPMEAFSGDGEECEYKISYTKGFSVLELQTGNQRKIGKHTDVYGIGAVLFYLVFGTVPAAPDCGMDAEYDYGKTRFAPKTFQDKMYYELTDFFHHTLANYYLNRYQDMQQVIRKLEEIEKLADTTLPYIQNPYVAFSKVIVGREEELRRLKRWGEKQDSPLLFVTGMGGIGKTSLVQRYLTDNAQSFDVMISLRFCRSLSGSHSAASCYGGVSDGGHSHDDGVETVAAGGTGRIAFGLRGIYEMLQDGGATDRSGRVSGAAF